MKREFLFILFSLWIIGCGSSNSTVTGSENQAGPIQLATGPNVLAVDAGRSCAGYVNEVCVSVTICEPASNHCQQIPRVLLDTGSYGLRLFSSVVTLNLPDRSIASGTMAECVGYQDGSSHWGPVKMADVILAENRARQIPIQIIDAQYPTRPADCPNPELSPAQAGYNGILGVGNLIPDCGPECATNPNNRLYFNCSGGACSPIAVALSDQVSNPISQLDANNNGFIVQLPAISASGAIAVQGALVLGIGTQDNNHLPGITTFPADSKGNFKTLFDGQILNTAFIDSGSNAFFFPESNQLPPCPADSNVKEFFCPETLTPLSATAFGFQGTPKTNVRFQILSAASIANSGNWLFNNLGGPEPTEFDWGLPFFFGRSVHVGIENKKSTLGTGPYWAF